jgi:undecaprenyl-diphosphatase
MDLIHSVMLGVIEGITEFLPVSSTGHLIVASSWFGLPSTDSNKAFDVIIQLAAILAVIANYRDKFTFKHTMLWLKVAVAFIPVGVVGLLFHTQIKAIFSVEVVAVMFILGGIVFLLIERNPKISSPTITDIEEITFFQAGIIGFAQVFALIPGTSRSGATIAGALILGISRKVSAEFSFLLALPVMIAASGLDLLQHYKDFSSSDFLALLVGFITAFISAYVVIKLFVSFINRFSFVPFAIYRIVFGFVILYGIIVGVI